MIQHPAIEAFLETYLQRQDYYARAGEVCREQCRQVLDQAGIRHIATSRAKRLERLRQKLYQRVAEGHSYEKDLDILNDIVDLAGVRIALYFPGDIGDATRALSDHFDVERTRQFPMTIQRRGADVYSYRFSGYSATHLQVRVKPINLEGDDAHYAAARIEVQVASVFMHAWSEVEHDLVYKPLRGLLSVAEYKLLDQVNGLANAGEIALEQLQQAMRDRISTANRRFTSHYDLASFIHSALAPPPERDMGRADQLLAFLRDVELDRPSELEQIMGDLANETAASPIVKSVVDRIISSDPDKRDERSRAWKQVTARDLTTDPADVETTDDSWGDYVLARRLRKRWRTFEQAARHAARGAGSGAAATSHGWLTRPVLDQLGFDGAEASAIAEAQQIYTRLITDNWSKDDAALQRHSLGLERAIRKLYERFPGLASHDAAGDVDG